MKKFIALSKSSKQALSIAQMSSSLPVNIIILGEIGVGRKLLAREIAVDAHSFNGNELEKLIQDDKINLQEYSTLIIYDFHRVINKREFLKRVYHIKIVATALNGTQNDIENFAVKIELEPLAIRKEDLEEISKIYIDSAKRFYSIENISHNVESDLSQNGVSLKHSIYKALLLHSMDKRDIMELLYNFFLREIEGKSYKTLLEIFEIPLLRASKKVYKSQLKMSDKLEINRMTIRKKLTQYFGK